jgi:ATP-binding cassette, subfamily C (CFTR/MRP), member 1
LGFYLLITALLRAAVVRTYWYIDGFHTTASISLTSLLVQIGILALESCSKRQWLIDSSRGGSPEESASFLSRSLFAWLNHLFLTGYRRQLTDFDVQIIDSSLSGQGLEPQYERLVATKKCN